MRPSGKRTEGRALYVTTIGRLVVIVLAFVKTPRPRHQAALERDRVLNHAHPVRHAEAEVDEGSQVPRRV
jgi:hypothetical protein